MTMNWSQEKYDCSTWSEREAERQLRAHPESLVSKPTSQTDHALIDREETESRSTAGHPQWKMWFVGRGVMLAALAGAMIFFFLNVASIGVLGSALTVAGVVAAVGLGHYLLWGRVFVRGAVRERQRYSRASRLDQKPAKRSRPTSFPWDSTRLLAWPRPRTRFRPTSGSRRSSKRAFAVRCSATTWTPASATFRAWEPRSGSRRLTLPGPRRSSINIEAVPKGGSAGGNPVSPRRPAARSLARGRAAQLSRNQVRWRVAGEGAQR